jgi:hypothetical protein
MLRVKVKIKSLKKFLHAMQILPITASLIPTKTKIKRKAGEASNFWVVFFGSLRYRIMSSANKDSLTISLPTYIPFISS